MAVSIGPASSASALKPGTPRKLFATQLTDLRDRRTNYVVLQNGARFIINAPIIPYTNPPLVIVTGWLPDTAR